MSGRSFQTFEFTCSHNIFPLMPSSAKRDNTKSKRKKNPPKKSRTDSAPLPLLPSLPFFTCNEYNTPDGAPAGPSFLVEVYGVPACTTPQ